MFLFGFIPFAIVIYELVKCCRKSSEIDHIEETPSILSIQVAKGSIGLISDNDTPEDMFRQICETHIFKTIMRDSSMTLDEVTQLKKEIMTLFLHLINDTHHTNSDVETDSDSDEFKSENWIDIVMKETGALNRNQIKMDYNNLIYSLAKIYEQRL